MSNRRKPPHATDSLNATEAEQGVLGACIIDPAKLEYVAGALRPESFHDPLHQRIMSCMTRLMQADAAGVSYATLRSAMKGDPGLATLDTDYLNALAESAPSITSIKALTAIVADMAERRRLADIGRGLVEGANESVHESPTAALAASAMEALLEVGATTSAPAVRPYDVAGRVLDRAEAHLRGEKPQAITTGLKKLDKAIGGGLQATDFMGIAGRSGMGKSALLRSIAMSAAAAGNPTLFFSTEMSADQLTQLMLTDLDFRQKLTDEHKIETWKFRAACLSNHEISRLRRAREALDGLPFEICDDADLTMGAIRARSRAFQSKHKGQMILVLTDFLQNIADEERTHQDNRETSVSRLAYGHKKLAKMLGCAVGAAIQLKNKGDGKRARDALPTADDVRESGAIEMAADLLISPYRKAFFVRGEEPIGSHDDPAWAAWKEKYDLVKNDLWLRGFKNRHGDPGSLNIELWTDLSVGAIRDERPGRYRLGETSDDIPTADLKF